MNIISIDIGTSNIKAVILNDKGKVLQSFKSSTKTIKPKPGWNEQNADDIFKIVFQLLKKSIAYCKEEKIVCVTFSAAMHSLLAVDKDGKPLTNMMTWADLRSTKYSQSIKQTELARKLYEVTGVPNHAMLPLYKLMWMKHEAKKIFSKAHKFISIKEYIFYRLFGKYIIDYSIAAATGLFDETKLCWYDEAMQLARVTTEQLSTLKPVEHHETELIPSIKKQLHIKQNIPFVLGGSDGAMANIGCGITGGKNAVVTVGTSGAVRITSNKYLIDDKQRLFCYYLNDNMYITGGAINNGGVALQWAIEKLLKQNFSNEQKLNRLLQQALQIKPGAGGLIFLPYILGERSTVWDEKARGALIGLTAEHTDLNIVKAVLEGICFSIYDVMKALQETDSNIENIFLSGGIIRTKGWVQLMADITGKKILVNEAADASAMGAAFIGMKAIGLINQLPGETIFSKQVQLYKPNAVNNKLYNKYFQMYRGLYHKLKDDFDTLNDYL